MRAIRPTIARRAAVLLALSAVVATTLMAGTALAATSTKPYFTTIITQSAPAGAFGTYTVEISNESNQPMLGSANWTIDPAFYNISNVVLPDGATLEGTVSNTLKLRNLAIAAQSSKSFSYDATAPCLESTYTGFKISAKQSNDYKGPPGNDFILDAGASDLDVQVTGACTFAFAFDGDAQPADSQIDTNITTETYNENGAPIKVVLLDGDGAVASTVEAEIELWIPAVNAGCAIVTPCGKLNGDRFEDTVNGVATFLRPPDDATRALSIDVSGVGYTLHAKGKLLPSGSTLGLAGGESAPFNVQDVGQICEGGDCQGTAYGKQYDATYILDATADQGDLLTVGVTTSVIDCANLQAEFGLTFVPHTDTVTTDFTGDGTKTLTMSFTNTRRESKSSFRVCYSQPDLLDLEGVAVPWVDRFGVTRSGEAESYLQDCSKTTPRDTPPCVISVDSDPTKPKIIVIKILLPEGDPKGRG